MQKKIIALAVAAIASGAAFAQSNVTIYGVADAAFASSKTDEAKRQNLISSGGLAASRLGFKGSEDLGNGLKAIFALEYRLEIDGNNALGFASTVGSAGPARQQLVGLTGGFGTAVAGRLQTTGYDWALKYDLLAGTAFSPLQNVNTASGASAAGTGFLIGGTTVAARASNAVAYISPSFGGFSFAYNHAEAGEQTLNYRSDNIPVDLLGAYYDNGPLSVGLVFANAKANGVANTATAKTQDWALGGSYDFGVVKLGATFQTNKNEGNEGYLLSNKRNNAWSVSAAVPVSANGKVIASYAKNSIKSTDTVGAASLNDNTKSWTVAYTHSLSKRTTAYVGYNAIERDNDITPTIANLPAGVTSNGADTGTFITGINHKF